MLHRPLRRAAALSLGVLLAFAGTASADTLFADADAMTPIPDGSKHLGDVSPGGTVSRDIGFLLLCAGLQHVDASQSVVLSWSGLGNEPLDGEIVSVTSVAFALETPWAADSQGCPDPVPSQAGKGTSRVTLRAPTAEGLHTYTIVWDRSLQPGGNNDLNAFSRTLTSVDLTLRVLPNAAPTLTVPASFEVEGNTTGGWTADWSDVSATDPEDDPDPTPTCDPPTGEVVALDTTEVTCSVTDLAGAKVSKSFNVTVVDSTRPTLLVPTDISVTTNDPTGRVVTFDDPYASDVVDSSPTVSCSHPSGFKFAVDTTTVTCTATDDRGNSRTASFDVTVYLEAPPHAASATWLEPVAGGGTTFEANRGRTLPIKVRLFVDGAERSSGDAELTLTPCDGGSAIHLDLGWSGGRWNHSLDTSMLSGACYDIRATIDGLTAGSFRLMLRGDEAAKTATKPATKRLATTTISVERREKPSTKKAR
jgi:HYR domain